MQGQNTTISNALYAPNQRPLNDTMSLIGKIQGSWDQGLEAGVAPLIITLNDSPGEALLTIPTTLFWRAKVLNPQRGTLLPRDTVRAPMSYKLGLLLAL